MALKPKEVVEGELAQLRALVQSPGWDLFRAHALKRAQSRDKARANLQRECKHELAYGELRQIDGIHETLDLIHQVMEGMASSVRVEETSPAYA